MAYYFEDDPLQQVYEDLYRDKTPTQFDAVLALKGMAQEAFYEAVKDNPSSIHHQPKHPQTIRKGVRYEPTHNHI